MKASAASISLRFLLFENSSVTWSDSLSGFLCETLGTHVPFTVLGESRHGDVTIVAHRAGHCKSHFHSFTIVAAYIRTDLPSLLTTLGIGVSD